MFYLSLSRIALSSSTSLVSVSAEPFSSFTKSRVSWRRFWALARTFLSAFSASSCPRTLINSVLNCWIYDSFLRRISQKAITPRRASRLTTITPAGTEFVSVILSESLLSSVPCFASFLSCAGLLSLAFAFTSLRESKAAQPSQTLLQYADLTLSRHYLPELFEHLGGQPWLHRFSDQILLPKLSSVGLTLDSRHEVQTCQLALELVCSLS
ncbi:Uncharacterised protein [Streptococcus pneumoniae]|nr:Uncharacterised protein [Streptococcus pneumoniae]